MDRDRIKRIYDLHAWAGITAGLFLYIVCLSGVFALFGAELVTWEDEKARIVVGDDPVPVMPLVEAFAAEVADGSGLLSLSVDLPTSIAPYYRAEALMRTPTDGTRRFVERRWNPNTGEVLPERDDGLVLWIVDFHRSLMLPRSWGRAVVGLAGVLLTLMIVSGLVSHRKIVRGAFVWRFGRSLRVLWSDSHKALALWGTPFSFMIAFTGAWLGFVALFLPLAATVASQEDAAAIEALAADPPAPAGPQRTMYPIDEAARAVTEQLGLRPISFRVSSWGHEGARYHVRYVPDRGLVVPASLEVDAVTGDVHPPPDPRTGLFAIPGILTALHYAVFGGLWVKLLYVVLGLVLSAVTFSGLLIWLERRIHGHAGSAPRAFYQGLGRLVVGVSVGMALSTVAIFYVDRLYVPAPVSRIAAVGIGFFLSWIGAVGYALVVESVYRSCRNLIFATAVACLGIPFLNAVATGDTAFHSLAQGLPFVAGVDIAALVSGVLLFCTGRRMPSSRPARLRRKERTAGHLGVSRPAG